MRLFWMTILAGMVLSNPIKVAAITYNEAVNGDLPTFVQDSDVFNLDIGTNTFIGELTFSNADFPLPQTDFDSFAFSIPTETRLESVLLSISLLTGGSGIFSTTGYDLTSTPFNNNIANESIPIPSTNLSLFSLVLPLESGLFGFQNSFLSGALQSGEFQTATYTFSLNVADDAESVPEPTSIVGILAFSIYGVASAFKKKQELR
jgi:hypothetical protein